MSLSLPSWTALDLFLAQTGRDETLREVSELARSRTGNTFDRVSTLVLTLAAILLLAWLACRLFRYYLKTVRSEDHNTRLFADLCAAHRLSHHQSSLLRNLADRLGLDEPSVLFVRKSLLERELHREPRPDFRDLMHKLFD